LLNEHFPKHQGSLPCSKDPTRLIQSILLHPISQTSILILSSHPCLFLHRDLFLLTKTLYIFLLPTMRATCPVQLRVIHLIVLITFGEEYKLWSSSLCSCLQPRIIYYYYYYYYIELNYLSRDSVIGIATGYGLDDGGVGVPVPVRSKIFSMPSRPALGSTHPLNQWVTGALSPWRGKAAGT
jgi:hypothetical protein